MAELVPRKVERWAYLADSKGQSGYRGEGNPKNTDTATFIREYAGGRIEVANYGRGSETTRSMLGKDAVKGRREDRVGKVLSGNFDGIIIEVGVNDVASRGGGGQERWEKNFRGMKKNNIEMHMRAWARGASDAEIGTAGKELGRRIGEMRERAKELEKENETPASSARERAIARNRETEIAFLKEKMETLEMAKDSLSGAGNGGKRLKRVIFVEIAPWKEGGRSWTEEKGGRTREYNRMLHGVAATLNGALGEFGGPKAEVAEVYGIMGSMEDGEKLHSEYAGTGKGGRKDYLHPGVKGRETMAAGIVLGHFPEIAKNRDALGELASRNQGVQEKGKRMLARR